MIGTVLLGDSRVSCFIGKKTGPAYLQSASERV